MRIIAGKARSLPLKTVQGLDTRPTTDRIKETLFNMIQDQLPNSRFLDLFAGSGGIGLEAVSRGAVLAVLVEKNPKACACIQHNMQFTHLDQGCQLLPKDVFAALRQLEGQPPFQVIFMDPPYNQQLEQQVLAQLADSALVDQDTLLIVEASLDTEFDYLDQLGYKMIKVKKYKTNVHVFIKRQT